MAAQFKATNGPRARPEASCSTRARTSLPEPVGPTSKAVTSARATFWARASRCWLAGSTKTTLRVGGVLVRQGLGLSALCRRIHEALRVSQAANTARAPD